MSDKRKRAADLERRAAESFERSDTDGFLSQWALGISAEKLRVQADIDDNDGMAEFVGLYFDDGPPWTRVDAKLIDGHYGLVWLLGDEAADRLGRRFIPYDHSHDLELDGRSRVQVNLGLIQKNEWARARAVIRSSGTGLAGAASAYVAIIRIDD